MYYEEPSIDIIRIFQEDIITASGDGTLTPTPTPNPDPEEGKPDWSIPF